MWLAELNRMKMNASPLMFGAGGTIFSEEGPSK
jgi:hypothetical protein